MAARNSKMPAQRRGRQNIVRRPDSDLDATDLRILEVLANDARIPNNALAHEVGIAPSTCLGRVRALREREVIRGFYADVDPAAIGRPIQAMVAVRLQTAARTRIGEFARSVSTLPEVMNVYFLGGAMDYYVHVASASTQSLRDFVVINLSGNPDVAHTETSLIFEHVRQRRQTQ
jgi:DNA-binding Lrp family transcriptional regulator